MDKDDIHASRRIFIYSETDFSDESIISLKAYAKSIGHDLQFRGENFRAERSAKAMKPGLN